MLAIIGWICVGIGLTVALAVGVGFIMASRLGVNSQSLKSCRQCGKRFSMNGSENWIFCAQCLTWYCGDHRDHAGHPQSPKAGD